MPYRRLATFLIPVGIGFLAHLSNAHAQSTPPGAPELTFMFRSIVTAPSSGATVAELGQATAKGLSQACLSDRQQMVAVLHAPDSLDASTGIYAVSATVGLLPPSDGPLQWPQDSYAMTSAVAGLDAAGRKKLALDATEAAARALCRMVAAQRAQPSPARTP